MAQLHAGVIHETLTSAGFPVTGVTVGRIDDPTTWVITPMTPELDAYCASLTYDAWRRKAALVTLRRERNARLAASDWTQLGDAPQVSQAAWRAYRQALRDLPATVADPEAPVWPNPPA